MSVTITGIDQMLSSMQVLKHRIQNPEEAANRLAGYMRNVVHVITGHLKDTIYSDGVEAGARADYAQYERARGGEHDFVQVALDNFDIEEYTRWLLEGI